MHKSLGAEVENAQINKFIWQNNEIIGGIFQNEFLYFNSWSIKTGNHLSKLNLSDYLDSNPDELELWYYLLNDLIFVCFDSTYYPRDEQGSLTYGSNRKGFSFYALDFSGVDFYTEGIGGTYNRNVHTNCDSNIENYASIVFDKHMIIDDFNNIDPNVIEGYLITELYYIDQTNERSRHAISTNFLQDLFYDIELLTLSNLGKFVIYKLNTMTFHETTGRRYILNSTIEMINAYEETAKTLNITELNFDEAKSLIWKDDDSKAVSIDSPRTLKFYNFDDINNYEIMDHDFDVINGKWYGETLKLLGIKNGTYYIFDTLGNEIELEANSLSNVIWSENTNYILHTEGNTHLLYDSNTGKLIHEFVIENSKAQISPNSNYIAFSTNNEIHVYDIITKELICILTLELPKKNYLTIIIITTIAILVVFGRLYYKKQSLKRL
ncbi:MAG: hypothetical protein OEZ01_06880 [Candidatus Heimdallarchaeota archaeon]|nr:hypothetical protein [Candidatus Heimdallarchaeota archaeon]